MIFLALCFNIYLILIIKEKNIHLVCITWQSCK